jgi:uncharacterized damage-inducible protein DinB
VADTRPPRLAGGERETLLVALRYQRESLVRKVSGVDEAAARRSPVPSGTSLLWLVKHTAHAERLWIIQRFGGADEPIGTGALDDGDTVEGVVAGYRATWARTEAVVAGVADLDQPCARAVHGDTRPVNLRWVLTHLVEETARHAGHADILRELIDGDTGR